MPPSPVVVEVPASLAPPRPSASFAGAESAPKLMPAIVIGIFRWSGAFAELVPDDDVRGKSQRLAVALERVARDAGAEQQEIVKGEPPLGPETADVVDPLARGALNLCDHRAVEQVRLAEAPACVGRHQYAVALSTLKL